MRIVVDLPQPEGPSSTTNSPSATVSDTASTPTTLPQRRETPLSSTEAMRQPAGRKAESNGTVSLPPPASVRVRLPSPIAISAISVQPSGSGMAPRA